MWLQATAFRIQESTLALKRRATCRNFKANVPESTRYKRDPSKQAARQVNNKPGWMYRKLTHLVATYVADVGTDWQQTHVSV